MHLDLFLSVFTINLFHSVIIHDTQLRKYAETIASNSKLHSCNTVGLYE